MKRAMRNAKEKIRLALISPNEIRWWHSRRSATSGAGAMCRFGVGYGPRCAVPYSTGRSVSVLQRQLPSLAFWKANDFSMVRR